MVRGGIGYSMTTGASCKIFILPKMIGQTNVLVTVWKFYELLAGTSKNNTVLIFWIDSNPIVWVSFVVFNDNFD